MDFSSVRAIRLDATDLLAKREAVAVWLAGSAQPLYFALGSALAQELVRYAKSIASYARFEHVGSCLFAHEAVVRKETDADGSLLVWLYDDPVAWRFACDGEATERRTAIAS